MTTTSEPRHPRPGEAFRSVNDRICDLGDGWGTTQYAFICECVDDHCFESLPMTRTEFDAARAARGSYVVVPGHERAGVDEVLERHERYTLVSRASR